MKIKMTFIAVLFAVLAACGGDDSDAAKESTVSSNSVTTNDAPSTDISKADIEDAKKQALAACDAQMDQVPAEMKDQIKSMCECSIENTDFEKVAKLTEAGDADAVMALTMESAKKCMDF